MGILNRSLLFVYTLFFGVLCAGIVALCLHIVPERVVLNEYDYLANQWQTGAVAGVFLLVSIHLLLCSLSGSRSKEINAKELLVVQGVIWLRDSPPACMGCAWRRQRPWWSGARTRVIS